MLCRVLFICLVINLSSPAHGSQPGFQFEVIESKNCTSRRPDMLVLHYSGGSRKSDISWITEHKKASAHYYVDKEGKVIRFVDETRRAWHSGHGTWRGFTDINSRSIGIETENFGFQSNDKHPKGGIKVKGSPHLWYPFSPQLTKTLTAVCKDIVTRYKIKPQFVLGHSDVDPGRKVDPGPLFPWKDLYKAGVGAWFNLEAPLNKVALPQDCSVPWMQQHLSLYGYKAPQNGSLDQDTINVIQAFQMHFRPDDISGKIDKETMWILASLLDRYGH